MYNHKKTNFKTFEKTVNMNITETWRVITDPIKIANTFNDYLANIGTDLSANICEYVCRRIFENI